MSAMATVEEHLAGILAVVVPLQAVTVALPDAAGSTRTASRCPLSVIDTAPNPGSRPVTDVGSMLSTSVLGS